jgi:hypothetical protein
MSDLGLGYHCRLCLFDSRPIAPEPWQRRLAMECVLKVSAEFRLLAVSMPDSHLHAEAVCSRAEAGELQRRLGISLSKKLKLPVRFQSYEPKPIVSPAHRLSCLKYVVTQDVRHALVDWDPYREYTNLPDLIGARLNGRYTARNVSYFLPRLKIRELYQWIGIAPLDPAELPHTSAPVFEGIYEATLRAACLLDLQTRTPAHQAASRAALAVLGDRYTQQQAACLLGLSRSTVQRAHRQPADALLVRAIQLQLVWSTRVQGPRIIADH